ncbi:putative uncharacterized protein LOC103934149 isoform X3 [Diplonema papillatum]|nr:putative uncharacterized protein LOC103934149 isoform X3 [Diplonema papillatum]
MPEDPDTEGEDRQGNGNLGTGESKPSAKGDADEGAEPGEMSPRRPADVETGRLPELESENVVETAANTEEATPTESCAPAPETQGKLQPDEDIEAECAPNAHSDEANCKPVTQEPQQPVDCGNGSDSKPAQDGGMEIDEESKLATPQDQQEQRQPDTKEHEQALPENEEHSEESDLQGRRTEATPKSFLNEVATSDPEPKLSIASSNDQANSVVHFESHVTHPKQPARALNMAASGQESTTTTITTTTTTSGSVPTIRTVTSCPSTQKVTSNTLSPVAAVPTALPHSEPPIPVALPLASQPPPPAVSPTPVPAPPAGGKAWVALPNAVPPAVTAVAVAAHPAQVENAFTVEGANDDEQQQSQPWCHLVPVKCSHPFTNATISILHPVFVIRRSASVAKGKLLCKVSLAHDEDEPHAVVETLSSSIAVSVNGKTIRRNASRVLAHGDELSLDLSGNNNLFTVLIDASKARALMQQLPSVSDAQSTAGGDRSGSADRARLKKKRKIVPSGTTAAGIPSDAQRSNQGGEGMESTVDGESLAQTICREVATPTEPQPCVPAAMTMTMSQPPLATQVSSSVTVPTVSSIPPIAHNISQPMQAMPNQQVSAIPPMQTMQTMQTLQPLPNLQSLQAMPSTANALSEMQVPALAGPPRSFTKNLDRSEHPCSSCGLSLCSWFRTCPLCSMPVMQSPTSPEAAQRKSILTTRTQAPVQLQVAQSSSRPLGLDEHIRQLVSHLCVGGQEVSGSATNASPYPRLSANPQSATPNQKEGPLLAISSSNLALPFVPSAAVAAASNVGGVSVRDAAASAASQLAEPLKQTVGFFEKTESSATFMQWKRPNSPNAQPGGSCSGPSNAPEVTDGYKSDDDVVLSANDKAAATATCNKRLLSSRGGYDSAEGCAARAPSLKRRKTKDTPALASAARRRLCSLTTGGQEMEIDTAASSAVGIVRSDSPTENSPGPVIGSGRPKSSAAPKESSAPPAPAENTAESLGKLVTLQLKSMPQPPQVGERQAPTQNLPQATQQVPQVTQQVAQQVTQQPTQQTQHQQSTRQIATVGSHGEGKHPDPTPEERVHITAAARELSSWVVSPEDNAVDLEAEGYPYFFSAAEQAQLHAAIYLNTTVHQNVPCVANTPKTVHLRFPSEASDVSCETAVKGMAKRLGAFFLTFNPRNFTTVTPEPSPLQMQGLTALSSSGSSTGQIRASPAPRSATGSILLPPYSYDVTRTFSKKDKVTYLQKHVAGAAAKPPSGRKSSTYADAIAEPTGERGEVAITFPRNPNSKRVGVCFESPQANGTDLGGMCPQGRGLFVDASDLIPDTSTECCVPLRALAEVVQSYQPLVVYIPSVISSRYLMTDSGRYRTLKDILSGLTTRTCIVTASALPQAQKATESNEKEAKGNKKTTPPAEVKPGSSPSIQSKDFDALFPTVARLTPKPGQTESVRIKDNVLSVWKHRLESDKIFLRAVDNILLLQHLLAENNAACEWAAELCHIVSSCPVEKYSLSLLDELSSAAKMVPLAPDDAQMIVSWAVAHHLEHTKSIRLMQESTSDKTWPVTGSWGKDKTGRLIIHKEDLMHGFAVFSKSDSHHAESQKSTKGKSQLDSVETENDYEKRLLHDVIPAGSMRVSFNDIGALGNVKDVIKDVVLQPFQRPGLFSRSLLTTPAKGVLLFGPPGTGKTMVAKAIAASIRASFLCITASSVTSKWIGEGEKYASAVFTLAAKLAPSIVFVDEIDSLLGKRGERHEHESSRKIKNEFMTGWDGMRSHEQVLVIGATNRPQDLDDAVLRRLSRRLLVDLPDKNCRVDILRVLLKGENVAPDVNLESIASSTPGFTGSDLKNLCVAAVYRPIRAFLKENPCDFPLDSDPFEDKERSRLQLLKDAATPLPQVTQPDFEAALRSISATVHENAPAIEELRRWNEMYGEDGSRRPNSLSYYM